MTRRTAYVPTRGARRQRLLAWLLVAQQLVLGLGLPMPSSGAPARSSERFPCEHCACGCSTAEQCWRQCCCFTDAEKLAWARRNGVQPPAFVVAAAEKEAAAKKPKCPHCTGKHANKSEAAAPARRRTAEKRLPSAPASPARTTPLLVALRCHGLAGHALLAEATWAGDPPTRRSIEFPPAGGVDPEPLLGPLPCGPVPPTPPPKAT